MSVFDEKLFSTPILVHCDVIFISCESALSMTPIANPAANATAIITTFTTQCQNLCIFFPFGLICFFNRYGQIVSFYICIIHPVFILRHIFYQCVTHDTPTMQFNCICQCWFGPVCHVNTV